MMSKGIPLLARSTKTSESGDDNIPTSRRGQSTSFFSPITTRAEEIGKNHRKRGVHRDGAKHLQCTTPPSRREPRDNRRHPNDCAGDAITEIWDVRTGTSQCSNYQIEIRGNGTVVIYDCDHERHTGTIKNIHLCTNQPINIKKEALILDLREKIHSLEKNLLIKESRTSRWSVLQEKDGWKWKGMWMTVMENG